MTYCCTACQPELCWPSPVQAVAHVQRAHPDLVYVTGMHEQAVESVRELIAARKENA